MNEAERVGNGRVSYERKTGILTVMGYAVDVVDAADADMEKNVKIADVEMTCMRGIGKSDREWEWRSWL